VGLSEEQSEGMTDAEYVAERADTFRAARALLDQFEWDEPLSPEDVTGVAMFLAGDTTK
jgi:hypothetical protein